MSDVKWIKIATDMFDNRKIRQIEIMPDGDAIIVIWVKMLCLAGNINDRGLVYFTQEIPYTEQMLATQFNRPLPTVQLALRTFEQFGMVEIVDDIYHISSWEKYQNIEGLERIREQNRKRVAKHREKKKLEMLSNVTGNVTVMQSNAIDKKREEKKREDNILSDFFETLWKAYPKKKGKGQVSKSQKKLLHDIGQEEMLRAIDRYKTETKGTDPQYIMYGSTFFNSGYVDYLDKNYQPPQKRETKNSFNNFEQRDYDWNAIEKQLTGERKGV